MSTRSFLASLLPGMPLSARVCEGLDMQGLRAASTRHRAVPTRGAAHAGPDSIRAQLPLLLLVVLLLVGLAVLVSAAGPAQFGEPRLAGVPGLGRPLPDLDGGSGAGAPARSRTVEPTLPGWTTVVWMLGICMLVALVVRSAVRLLRARDEQPDARRDPGRPDAVRDLGLGPVLQQGVRNATRALEAAAGRGDERDAVILCWLALEEAASRSGSRRRDSQTPTEFTSVLLDAGRADPDATRELLGVYHRARFGTRPLPPGSVHRARSALERVDATLAAGRPQTRRIPQETERGKARA